MRTFALFLCAAAGCGSAAERLPGTWKLDPATFTSQPWFGDLTAREQDAILARSAGRITFTADTVSWDLALMHWERGTWEAKYEVTATDGNRITLALDGAPRKKLVVTCDGDKLQMGLKGRSIRFVRAASKK